MGLIKKLDIYVLKNFIPMLLGTFVISLFVVMMQFLWKYVDDLVGKGLELTVLAQFFFYASETLISLALPIAILLASLISFGNMGERLELLAIKAAGISLVRTMRPLAILMVILTVWSYHVQNVVAPNAQKQLMSLLFSIRQKSPELDIPEGVFYDGVQGMNLYVNHKNKETGMLYNCIIYNMRDGVNNAHIILSDSGKLETSADKQHLLLHLYNGEQFENLRNNALQTNNVPYRRETFVEKHFIIDFDQNFEMSDADFSNSARTKSIDKLELGIDSLNQLIDSTSHAFANDMQRGTLYVPNYSPAPNVQNELHKQEAAKAAKEKALKKEEDVKKETVNIDTLFSHLTNMQRMNVVQRALQKVNLANLDMEFKVEVMYQYGREQRMHKIQIWQKITLALACLVFFFIGAPLGAIIRKGGLGMPVVVAVIIFIFYYIINTLGYNLAYAGTIPPVVGMWVSTLVLAPIGAFLTIKSNNDSVVFNMDAYRNFFRKLWGIRTKRHITRKEVIINDPNYGEMATLLDRIVEDCKVYRKTKHLGRFPNYMHVYFRQERDESIQEISDRLEYCVDALSNSKDRIVLRDLNAFPVLDTHSHTAPFQRKNWNIVAGVLFPVGVFLIFRMARFRRRLSKDLKQIIKSGEKMAVRCRELQS